MRPILRIAILVVGTVTLTVLPLLVRAQIEPEVGRLAAKTAKMVAKTDAHRILTTPLASCLAATELCTELDAALHTELVNSIPGAQFIAREEAVKNLTRHGFLSIDGYLGALDDVASYAGTEVVISEYVLRKGSHCELLTRVADAKHLFELGEFGVRVSCIMFSTERVPPLKDLSGAFLIIPVQTGSGVGPIHAPSCVRCPQPRYTGFARRRGIEGPARILITVTEQGTVENARGVGAVEDGLARASMQAINAWQLRPAVGEDGKPFAARVLVWVTFRLPGSRAFPEMNPP